MANQTFKKNIPSETLFELLDSICLKNEKHYTLTIESFKKGVFKELIQKFIEFCKPYYHISKHKYLERKLTYNSFTTILRQICNFNKITYTSQIKYDKSSYGIVYYIYLPFPPLGEAHLRLEKVQGTGVAEPNPLLKVVTK
jgi:hypothetical protein